MVDLHNNTEKMRRYAILRAEEHKPGIRKSTECRWAN